MLYHQSRYVRTFMLYCGTLTGKTFQICGFFFFIWVLGLTVSMCIFKDLILGVKVTFLKPQQHQHQPQDGFTGLKFKLNTLSLSV